MGFAPESPVTASSRVSRQSHLPRFVACSSYTRCHLPSALNAQGAIGESTSSGGPTGFGVLTSEFLPVCSGVALLRAVSAEADWAPEFLGVNPKARIVSSHTAQIFELEFISRSTPSVSSKQSDSISTKLRSGTRYRTFLARERILKTARQTKNHQEKP